MRRGLLLAAGLAAGLSLRGGAAEAETLMQKAERWGEVHAAAIYCHRPDSDAFGRAAMSYLRRHASSTAQFNRLRDAYGVRAVSLALKPPSRAAGGSCFGFSRVYSDIWSILRGG
ncbi:MAG TPA: hypothetical protein VK844_08935 [Hyphomicrobiales bacterium]|nr:hypothetical protein [Hyphomicrobiales bacterium]